jgi:ubiquinol-cytochrome c reductase cytochrome c1 subunit
MTKLRLFALLLAFAPALGLAASSGPLESSGTDLSDKASLQRGAGLFMNYCSGCHALSMHR